MCLFQQTFQEINAGSSNGRRRVLTVSVVPKYAQAIMDGEADGFAGLNSEEISSDPEASALAEQFAITVRFGC